MYFKRTILVLGMLALILAACGALQPGERLTVLTEGAGAPAPSGVGAPAPAVFAEPAPVEEKSVASTANLDFDQSSIELPAEPLIIRTGSLSLVVADTDEAVAGITAQVQSLGGWVLSTNLYQVGESTQGDITVRVPVDKFDQAMQAFKGLAVEVTGESTSGQDVTEEFVDVVARLDNLQATADRVRSFLDEARDVEDALAVNQELSRLEGEIESLQGRKKYLEQSAAFSSISISLIPDEAFQPISVAGWRPEGVAKGAIEDLVSALQGLANVAIRLVLFLLPLLLVIGVPLYLVARGVWHLVRRRRQGRPAAEAAEQ